MFVHERKLSEERTGKAKTSVPNKKKKEMYEEKRIVIFLGELGVGCPAFIRGRCNRSGGSLGPFGMPERRSKNSVSPLITYW